MADEEEEERARLEDLASKIERLEGAINLLRKPYGELLGHLDRLQEIARSYFRLLDLLERYGSLSPDMAIPGLKDPISRDIVKALFEKGDRNISQITEAVRKLRGKASRRIIRERLQTLESRGVVVATTQSRGKVYDVSDETVRRWSKVLGLVGPKSGSEGED
ncbi:MAG: transcriptional regulator [Candidatus Thermoplasmatota archaeon]|nr:transcriptional regulator [Candidatus Thermoplasmatota archaeon]